MKCDVFKENVLKYIHENLTDEENSLMEKHLKECEKCRALYEEEKEIEELLKDTLECKDIEFNSRIGNVLENIDKEKYLKGSNPKTDVVVLEDIKKSRKKGIHKYLATAATLVFVLSSAFIFNRTSSDINTVDFAERTKFDIEDNDNSDADMSNYGMEDDSNRKADEYKKEEMASSVSDNKDSSTEEIETEEGKVEVSANTPEAKGLSVQNDADESNVEFNKAEVSTIDESNKTPWKTITNEKEASIINRGSEGIEEGVGSIAVRDITSKAIDVYNINSEILTPKFIEELDDENSLIIIGFAHGRVSKGGDVYILNLETGEATPLYVKNDDKREEVVEIYNYEEKLELKIIRFDENMQEYTSYYGVIEKVDNGTLGNKLKIYSLDNNTLLDEVDLNYKN